MQPTTEQHLRWVLFAAILASSMAFIDSTALNVGLPAIQTSLHASGAQLLWIVNSYLLMLACWLWRSSGRWRWFCSPARSNGELRR